MKHSCCGKSLTKQYTHPNKQGGRTHVWKCFVCKKRYTQRTRVPGGEITNPCSHFRPVTSRLQIIGVYIIDSQGRKQNATHFNRPLDPDGWASYTGVDGKEYPINECKGFRTSGR